MGREFIVPRRIYTGYDALKLAEEQLINLGKKALIVTDPLMLKLGNLADLEEMFNKNQIAYSVFSEIEGEPTDKMVESGVTCYRSEGCDFLVALGGGSPIDTMKAIGVMASSGGKISDYMGKVIDLKLPPMAAIPTTAGTGSEATQFTIITDTDKDIKMLLKGACLLPDLAIVDPKFTLTAPGSVTSATGLDALTHAVEAYVSIKAQPLSDTFAVSAIKKIFEYLPAAYQNGSDRVAREQMAIASLEAGIAFNNASVTIVHGMSRPIGALFHVPHGLSNAMLLEQCLSFVLDGAYDRFGELGRVVGLADAGDDDEKASRIFMSALKDICHKLDVPDLKTYGIDREKYHSLIGKMAEDAMASGSPQNSRKALTGADLEAIYRRLYQ